MATQARALKAAVAFSSALKPIEKGAGIKIWKDAKVYLAPPKIAANDWLSTGGDRRRLSFRTGHLRFGGGCR